MSKITHSLVGYDRKTERVAEEFDVPDAALPLAKKLARVPSDDIDAVMCYPLDPAGARNLAAMLNATIDIDRCDYFLEGFAGAEPTFAFDSDAVFRSDPLGWSVWVHYVTGKKHIKVIVGDRVALDDFASEQGLRGHAAVIDGLNQRLRGSVQHRINQAISDGRATNWVTEAGHVKGRLRLSESDLRTMLDG